MSEWTMPTGRWRHGGHVSCMLVSGANDHQNDQKIVQTSSESELCFDFLTRLKRLKKPSVVFILLP